MKVIKRVLPILILVGALAAGGFWFYQSRLASQAVASSEGFTQIVTVQQGGLSASISVVGELAAVQQADLYFERMDGTTTLLTLAVGAGNTVKAGQVLATIDPAPYQQALDQAESALQEAEKMLADLQEPPTELDFAQADLAVAQAKLDLTQARDALADLDAPDLTDLQAAVQDAQDNLELAKLHQTLDDNSSLAKSERNLVYAVQWHQRRFWELQDLVSRGKANQEQMDELATEQETLAEAQADLARVQAQRQVSTQAAAAAVASAQAVLADAQETLADAQAGGDALDRSKAQLVVQQAEVTLQAAEDARTALDEGASAIDLAAAQADLDKKRLAVSEAELDLAGATLSASFDGTVLETAVKSGDRITANTLVLTVADLSRLQVLASVDETTIRQVAVGQAAEISFDAFPGQTFTGQVASVPLQGSLQGGVTVYEVPISLEGAGDLPLLAGMTANVEVKVGQVENALLVPTMALQSVGGMYQVLVPNENDPAGGTQAVPVEIGLSDGVYTQVVRGLNVGDQVVVELAATTSTTDMGAMGAMMGGGGGPPAGGGGPPPGQ